MKPSSKLRDRLKAATGEAILDAAEAVFAEEGLHAAKIEQIAALAGVSVGTLYNYFGDRDGILRAIAEQRRLELFARLDAVLEGERQRPFAAQVRAFVVALTAHFEAHQRFFSILMDADTARPGETPYRSPKAVLQAVYERARTLMDRGVASGALPAPMADIAPVLLMSIVRGLSLRAINTKRGHIAAQAEMLTTFFLRGAGVVDERR